MIQTVIVILVVAGAAFLIGRRLVRMLKGRGGCGCGCDNCPMRGGNGCHCGDNNHDL